MTAGLERQPEAAYPQPTASEVYESPSSTLESSKIHSVLRYFSGLDAIPFERAVGAVVIVQWLITQISSSHYYAQIIPGLPHLYLVFYICLFVPYEKGRSRICSRTKNQAPAPPRVGSDRIWAIDDAPKGPGNSSDD